MLSKQTMLAGRLNVETKEFCVKEVPVPSPGPDDVRIKVGAAGVCLSDVHLISGMVSPPRITTGELTLGHEVAGTVEALGANVQDWSVRDRVVVQALINRPDGVHTLGLDYDGGWAEYLVTPASTLVRLDEAISFETASVIPDAVSTPWAAIEASAQVRAGESVGVWGVGGLGVHAVQLLRLVGAVPIVAVDPLKAARDRALRLGADIALDPDAAEFGSAIGAATANRGLDVIFDFAGFPASQLEAQRHLANHGRLVLVGISGQPVVIEDSVTFTLKQNSVLGHYGSLAPHLAQLVDFVQRGRLDLSESISDVLPLSDAPEAIRRLQDKIGNPVRLVLRP
ncbi:L-threonine 3-dehydrogenase [Mycobacterium sp. THAF192]|nr:L-threonine 3-dehydrogenase [Mycobacterium sp. THAF192]